MPGQIMKTKILMDSLIRIYLDMPDHALLILFKGPKNVAVLKVWTLF